MELRPATRSPPLLLPTRALSSDPALLRTLNRIDSAYAAAAKQHSAKCKRTLSILAKRLSEMIDFLAHLFALEQSGTLDFSAMSESMREHMHR